MLAHAITPILNVSDIKESFTWFAKLGLPKRWDWGDPPTFGAVGSGPVEIFLCQQCQGGGGVWTTLWVDDVDAVLETCLAEGILVIRPPQNESWNVREMHIRHPDGHVFRISRGLWEEPDHEHPHDHDHPHEHEHEHHH